MATLTSKLGLIAIVTLLGLSCRAQEAGGPISVPAKRESITGLVLLRSTPPGADIEISGAHRGKTPLLLTDLIPGRYRLKASSSGYLSREVEFEVENRVPLLVSVSLASDSAVLTVRSDPPGASVKVNGLSKGVTPCTIDRLPAGENEVIVSLQDYTVYRSKVKLLANEAQSLDISLVLVPGALSVFSSPSGARIFVDEKLLGQTPLTLDAIEAGTHAVRAEMDAYVSVSKDVEIKQGEKKVEEFRLEMNVGTLVVMTRPEGVEVLVDGSEKGRVMQTPDNPVARFSQDLPVGAHTISLQLKGYGTVERRVTLEKGQTVTVKEVLKRVFVADTMITLRNGEIVSGYLTEKTSKGDVKLETQLGIYKTIKSEDISSMDPVKPDRKN